MTLSSRATTVLVVLLLAVAGIGGAYLGAATGRSVTEPGTQDVVLDDPAQAAGTPTWAQRSAGGFTGFGGLPALPGQVLRRGEILESDEASLTVEAPNALTTVEFTEPLRLFRIRAADAALAPGDGVIVRLTGGNVTGVLRLLIEQ